METPFNRNPISENLGSGTPLGETPFWGNTARGNCVSGNCVSENYVSGSHVSGIIPGDPFTGMNSSFNPGNRFAGSCFGDLNNFHITAFMRLTCKGMVGKFIYQLFVNILISMFLNCGQVTISWLRPVRGDGGTRGASRQVCHSILADQLILFQSGGWGGDIMPTALLLTCLPIFFYLPLAL